MHLIKVKIINCKTASVRKHPYLPLYANDIIAELKNGDDVTIDPGNVCYNWQGRKFYKTRNPNGWIYSGIIDYKEAVNSG